MRIADTFALLVGRWKVTRRLDDRRNGTIGTFDGLATLAADGTYDETGQMRWGEHVGPAERRLTYRPRPDGSVAVHFADGRLFVDLDLRTGVWRGVHLCGDDAYVIETAVRSNDHITERWEVRGPRKDYDAEMTSRRADVGRTDPAPT